MKILDPELREYRSKIGNEKFKKIQIKYCIKSKRIRDNNLRSSRKHLAKEFDFNQYSFCCIGDKLKMLTYYHPVKFRQKYTKNYIKALVNKIEIVDGKNTDLHIDEPVYAIYLNAVKEV